MKCVFKHQDWQMYVLKLNKKINTMVLFVLMYADDTILLAESEEDLQDALSAMFHYCNKWKLQVDVKKKT